METFPAVYFGFATRYPESGERIQLGNSYQFDSPPAAPDQRSFVLTLQGMCYFIDGAGSLDLTREPGRNLGKLEKFYNNHKRALPFLLNHPVYGQVTCKFMTPLQIPEGIANGDGNVPPFQVELIEIP